jgi:hypothetical protein
MRLLALRYNPTFDDIMGAEGKHGQDLLLQSIGGSLRLPLFQNGACPFPCTPLLSVLMLVTQTDREVLTVFPGLRIVAVSM